jgi:N-acetylmuramoyl-L-alanine amidase
MFQMYNSNLKKTILKEIYYDNLKVAGKLSEEESPISHLSPPSSKKLFVFFLFVIPLALTSYSYFIPPATVDSAPHEPMPSSVLQEPNLLTPEAFPELTGSVYRTTASSEYLSYQLPDWTFSVDEGQSIDDYSLLIPRDDFLRLTSLFGLQIKTIVIDPGHGGKDPGATGAKGTKEKDITLDVALRLKQRLLKLDRFNVFLTRTQDEFLTLAARVDFAKEKRADLFISLHVNSLPNDSVNLIETYYFGPPLSSDTYRLAEEENKASHYSVSELMEIIQDIGNTVKRQESEMLAGAIQASLYSHISNLDPEVINSGVKMAPFVVLSQIEVPSVLVELSCITNESEEAKLKTSKYREKIASYIDEGIVTYLNMNYFKTMNGEKRHE